MDEDLHYEKRIISSNNKNKRLKQKISGDKTYEDLLVGWTQCSYLVPRKNKLCNIARSSHSIYCGNHQQQALCLPVSEGSVETTTDRERITCPIDPSHTIYKHKLQTHVAICNAKKYEINMLVKQYYKKDCNSGINYCNNYKSDIKEEIKEEEVDLDKLIEKINKSYREIELSIDYESHKVHDVSDLERITSYVRNAMERDYSKDSYSIKRRRHIDQDIAISYQMIKGKLLIPTNIHDHIVDNINDNNNNDSDKVFVEFGAGKGMLGLSVCVLEQRKDLLLVERGGNRLKADKLLGNYCRSHERIRMDIRDCFLPGVDMINNNNDIKNNDYIKNNENNNINNIDDNNDSHQTNNNTNNNDNNYTSSINSESDNNNNNPKPRKKVVFIAKHLCGVATDLTLRSAYYLRNSHCLGVALATCCHHACNYTDYVGKEFYHKKGFTESEFDILKHWSSWFGTDPVIFNGSKDNYNNNNNKSDRSDNDDHVGIVFKDSDTVDNNNDNSSNNKRNRFGKDDIHPTDHNNDHSNKSVIRPKNITREQMKSTGIKIKRILDFGRIDYIKKELKLDVKLVKYCDENLSPECMLLVSSFKDIF